MWDYEKRLQYPVNIKTPNAKLAQYIISQYGGPDGELGASMRYLSQRYSSPYREVSALLTDIGTEELGHFEMVATIVHQGVDRCVAEGAESAHSGRLNDFVDGHAGNVVDDETTDAAYHSAGEDAPGLALKQTGKAERGEGKQVVQQHGLPAPGVGTVKDQL